MGLSLDHITGKLNEVVIPYLCMDDNGGLIETIPHPRRTNHWPLSGPGYAHWAFAYELGGKLGTSRITYILYVSDKSGGVCTGFNEGLYLDYDESKFFGCDLDRLIEAFKERLDEMSVRLSRPNSV